MPDSIHLATDTPQKTALVLSAGGGFGAYQAGAWNILSKSLQPDIVIGASVGSLNGWAIAGGISPEQLCEFWRALEISQHLKFRFALPWNGFFDGAVLERVTRDLHARYSPKIEYGAVLTEWRSMKPRLFRSSEVTWQHLYASCAIPLVFKQRTIADRMYADGGLLGALPLWAATEFGATRVVAIDVWRLGLARLQRALLRFRTTPAIRASSLILAPSESLGSAKDSLFWNRSQIDRWIALGEKDARLLIDSGRLDGILQNNISIGECFERQ